MSAGGFACDTSTGCFIIADADSMIDVYLDAAAWPAEGRVDVARDAGTCPGIAGSWWGDCAAETMIHCVEDHDADLCKLMASPGILSVGDSVCRDPIANVTVA